MTPLVSFDEHLVAIVDQTDALATAAERAGLDARVPSCPRWTVDDLLSHLGEVHRWATANVTRNPNAEMVAREAAGRSPDGTADKVGWLREGAAALVDALQAAPADLRALVFLADAPDPREFWARRQAHETTIHRADALSATLGHLPTAGALDLDPAFAADGIDELLTGFLPRKSSRLRSDEPFALTVAATDVDRAWTVRVSADPPVTERGAAGSDHTVLAGTAAGLYLSLWNRADEISETGHDDALGLWRAKVRIGWH